MQSCKGIPELNWDDFRVFATAVRCQSLTAAAAELRLSIATVSRRVEALEHALDLKLLTRSSSGIEPTSHGQAIFERCLPALEAISAADRLAATLRTGGWSEPIRVTATDAVISEILAGALPALLRAEPDLRLDLTSDAGLVSLADRKADIAIRMARPTGSDLIARRLTTLHFGLYAAERYLDGREPDEIDLGAERLIAYDDSYGPIPEASWFKEAGLHAAVLLRLSSTRALAEAARAGAGIALLPTFLASRQRELVEIPTTRLMPAREVWLVSHRDFQRVAAFRRVREWIVACFRQVSPPGVRP